MTTEQLRTEVNRFAVWLQREADLHVLNLNLWSPKELRLDMISVDKGKRKQGRGTAAMREIVKFADAHGLTISLTPASKDPWYGTTSRSRLVAFYKRFGFVENKGRHRDFSISAGDMVRTPKPQPRTS